MILVSSLETDSVRVHETYLSIQGEGLHSGLLCFFIRTSGCDLRCHWCDSPSALPASSGKKANIQDLIKKIPQDIPLVQITGGEPLLQETGIVNLCEAIHLQNSKQIILLETAGHLSTQNVPKYVHIVMDIKLQSSGENRHDFQSNFPYLKKSDEIKFVIKDKSDYIESKEWISKHKLDQLCNILFSPARESMLPSTLADWVIEDRLPVRYQMQLHKNIWGNKESI